MQLRSYFSALLVVLLATSFASADWILTHHYKLDETTGATATDSVGSVDGVLTVAGGAADFSFDDDAVAGYDGGALHFTDADNHIIALGDDTLAFGTDDFKISMWVKRGILDDRQGLFGQSGVASDLNDHTMWARFQSGTDQLLFLVDKGDSDFSVTSIGAITDTTSWHHLEFARTYSAANNETTYAIYIDGTLDNSAVDPGAPYDISAINGAVFGSYDRTNIKSFEGAIDDIRIYGVPEPSSVVILSLGLLGVLAIRRR